MAGSTRYQGPQPQRLTGCRFWYLDGDDEDARAPVVAKAAQRAFDLAGLGGKNDTMGARIEIADRAFDVRYATYTDGRKQEHTVIVFADAWNFAVRFMHPSRKVLEVEFKGDWQRFERDAVLMALG